jgi:hypothetical protein
VVQHSRFPVKVRFLVSNNFRDYEELAEATLGLKTLDLDALEYSDASCAGHVNGKILNLADPGMVATMIAEFDDSSEQAQGGRWLFESRIPVRHRCYMLPYGF